MYYIKYQLGDKVKFKRFEYDDVDSCTKEIIETGYISHIGILEHTPSRGRSGYKIEYKIRVSWGCWGSWRLVAEKNILEKCGEYEKKSNYLTKI